MKFGNDWFIEGCRSCGKPAAGWTHAWAWKEWVECAVVKCRHLISREHACSDCGDMVLSAYVDAYDRARIREYMAYPARQPPL